MELRPYVKKNTLKRLCIFDSETDPFKGQRVPKPFTCGFKDLSTGDYTDFWGDDCIDQFFAFLEAEYTSKGIKCMIFVHNLGGFDIHLMLSYLEPGSMPQIINGRIASAYLGGQEFRDSYRLFPIALKGYQKDEFDYTKLEREVRELHKEDILLYQRHDCDYLGDLVSGFFELFGERPTIGNTSINYLQNFHSFERLRPSQDAKLRPYFYGGRNQCFEVGIIEGDFSVEDVNAMYPDTMKRFKHPVGNQMLIGRMIGKATAFVTWEGWNNGAVPMRREDGSLDFTQKRGRFYSTIHEINAGLDTGTIRIDRVIQTVGFYDWTDFGEFVDFCFEQRLKAKAAGDKVRDLFWKFVMNSAYGKFAQDPSNYESYQLSYEADGIPNPEDHYDEIEKPNGWRVKFRQGDMRVWSRPSRNRFKGFFNVATGASITGAARSQLLRGIANARRPLYCDTDSIICEELKEGPGIALDDGSGALGMWKLEARGELFACAGKKLYALFSYTQEKDDKGKPRETAVYKGRTIYCVKKASKGAVLSAADILKVAQGDVVRFKSDRPNFKLDGKVEFIERDISRTW